MVALTDTAVRMIERLIGNAAEGTCGLRIMVEPGGCAGLQYLLGLESAAMDGDEVYEAGAVKVFVDPHSLPIIHGTQIDYVEGLESSGFVFDNPNVASVCSCSKSFNAAWSGDAE